MKTRTIALILAVIAFVVISCWYLGCAGPSPIEKLTDDDFAYPVKIHFQNSRMIRVEAEEPNEEEREIRSFDTPQGWIYLVLL